MKDSDRTLGQLVFMFHLSLVDTQGQLKDVRVLLEQRQMRYDVVYNTVTVSISCILISSSLESGEAPSSHCLSSVASYMMQEKNIKFTK